MSKYFTKRDCFWEGAYYKAGAVVNTEANKVPKYFIKYGGKKPDISDPEPPVPPNAGPPINQPPANAREKLEEQAKELGISFDEKISDDELAEIIREFKAS